MCLLVHGKSITCDLPHPNLDTPSQPEKMFSSWRQLEILYTTKRRVLVEICFKQFAPSSLRRWCLCLFFLFEEGL